ncbi:MAG: hypothetical protein HYW78_04315 [Parcubacteria group bacterium]|nr:hypothetical protein [Parcubacteria group bacterium]
MKKNKTKKRRTFVQKSKEYKNKLKKYLEKNFGKKCGHIGADTISLDCVNCKSWIAYDFFSWFVEMIEMLDAKNIIK